MADAGRTFTVEDLERAYAFFAWAVIRHGEVYVPVLDRLERELTQAQRSAGARARCEHILDRYTREGGWKAIR